MELRLQIDDRYMEDLQRKLRLSRSTDVVREALTLLGWAVEERAKGREIVSANPSGDWQTQTKIAMQSLQNVRADEGA